MSGLMSNTTSAATKWCTQLLETRAPGVIELRPHHATSMATPAGAPLHLNEDKSLANAVSCPIVTGGPTDVARSPQP